MFSSIARPGSFVPRKFFHHRNSYLQAFGPCLRHRISCWVTSHCWAYRWCLFSGKRNQSCVQDSTLSVIDSNTLIIAVFVRLSFPTNTFFFFAIIFVVLAQRPLRAVYDVSQFYAGVCGTDFWALVLFGFLKNRGFGIDLKLNYDKNLNQTQKVRRHQSNTRKTISNVTTWNMKCVLLQFITYVNNLGLWPERFEKLPRNYPRWFGKPFEPNSTFWTVRLFWKTVSDPSLGFSHTPNFTERNESEAVVGATPPIKRNLTS